MILKNVKHIEIANAKFFLQKNAQYFIFWTFLDTKKSSMIYEKMIFKETMAVYYLHLIMLRLAGQVVLSPLQYIWHTTGLSGH